MFRDVAGFLVGIAFVLGRVPFWGRARFFHLTTVGLCMSINSVGLLVSLR